MAEKKPRLNLDRKLFHYVLPGVLIPTIVFLIATKGTDLGQSEEEAAAARLEQEMREKQLSARAENPESDAERDARLALEAEANRKAKIPKDLPPLPPAPSIDEESFRRQVNDLEKTRIEVSEGLSKSEQQSVIGSQTKSGKKSFVVYSAPKKEKILDNAVESTEDALTINKKSKEKEKPFFDDGNEKVKPFEGTVTAKRIESKYWLAPGTVLKGVLLNAIDTRIPGQITARITEPVYDSRYGKYLVVPAGSSLIGQYGSDVAHGQKRVMIAFSSLVTPSGGVIDLSGMRGSDALGRGRFPGKFHTHFWQRMGVATLFAFETIGMNRLSKSKTTVETNGTTTTTDNENSQAAQIITDAAMNDPRMLPVSPNITIEEGQVISIITTVSIDVPPVANKR